MIQWSGWIVAGLLALGMASFVHDRGRVNAECVELLLKAQRVDIRFAVMGAVKVLPYLVPQDTNNLTRARRVCHVVPWDQEGP